MPSASMRLWEWPCIPDCWLPESSFSFSPRVKEANNDKDQRNKGGQPGPMGVPSDDTKDGIAEPEGGDDEPD